jgi:hypothetical protein
MHAVFEASGQPTTELTNSRHRDQWDAWQFKLRKLKEFLRDKTKFKLSEREAKDAILFAVAKWYANRYCNGKGFEVGPNHGIGDSNYTNYIINWLLKLLDNCAYRETNLIPKRPKNPVKDEKLVKRLLEANPIRVYTKTGLKKVLERQERPLGWHPSTSRVKIKLEEEPVVPQPVAPALPEEPPGPAVEEPPLFPDNPVPRTDAPPIGPGLDFVEHPLQLQGMVALPVPEDHEGLGSQGGLEEWEVDLGDSQESLILSPVGGLQSRTRTTRGSLLNSAGDDQEGPDLEEDDEAPMPEPGAPPSAEPVGPADPPPLGVKGRFFEELFPDFTRVREFIQGAAKKLWGGKE